MATLVKFLIENENEVFAYFPKLKYKGKGLNVFMNTCYSHIGQHSQCSSLYAKDCRKATESEYQPLLRELESIGYNNLKICK